MLSGNSERRKADRALLRTIVEQFVARTGYRQSEIQQFERLAGGLMDIADPEAVGDIAELLCSHPETPPELIEKLFRLGDSCAKIAFERAPFAPFAELFAYAEHGPAELAAAIARRADLPRDVVSALAARSEGVALYALAANRQIYLDAAAQRLLTQVARDDLKLARLLLDREDLDIDPEPLFLAATASEREKIILSACRFALSSGVEASPREDRSLGVELEAMAMLRDESATVSRIADALDARKSRVRTIFHDEGGEPLALTFTALGIDVETATRLFICHRRPAAMEAKKMRALRALMTSTPVRAATRIVAAITGSGRLDRDPTRRAASWRDEAPAAVGARRRQTGARQAPIDGRKAS